jgi:hypothetical protein
MWARGHEPGASRPGGNQAAITGLGRPRRRLPECGRGHSVGFPPGDHGGDADQAQRRTDQPGARPGAPAGAGPRGNDRRDETCEREAQLGSESDAAQPHAGREHLTVERRPHRAGGRVHQAEHDDAGEEYQRIAPGPDGPQVRERQHGGSGRAAGEYQLAADPVGQTGPQRDRAQCDDVSQYADPQHWCLLQPDGVHRVGQRPYRENRARGGDDRGQGDPEYLPPVPPEQFADRQPYHFICRDLLLEHRGLVERAADEDPDHGHDGADPEHDAPSPGQQRVLGEGGDRDEDGGGDGLARLRAAEGEAGEERPAAFRRVLEGQRVRARLLTPGEEALQ